MGTPVEQLQLWSLPKAVPHEEVSAGAPGGLQQRLWAGARTASGVTAADGTAFSLRARPQKHGGIEDGKKKRVERAEATKEKGPQEERAPSLQHV